MNIDHKELQALAAELDHLASHAVSDRGKLQRAAEVMRALSGAEPPAQEQDKERAQTEALISELEYAILGASFAGNFDRIRAAKDALRAALAAPQPSAALADGWLPDGHLYAALNNLLCHLGMEGVVTVDHPFVLDTMAALKRIDGGAYLSNLAIPTEPDAYRADMLATVGLLEDGEWTEHHAKTPLGMRLEDEITKLHNELREIQDAAPPTLNASKEGGNG